MMDETLDRSGGITRRRFLVRSGLLGLSTWAILVDGPVRRAALAQPPMAPEAYGALEREILGPHEWRTVEAITARLLPSDDGLPGGREAGCVQFIDRRLKADTSLRERYSRGLAALDAVCRERFGKPFRELGADRQDRMLVALGDRSVIEEWREGEPDPGAFLETMREHAVLGFLAPAAYGGNRDYAGWRVTGYPGPGHRNGGYSVQQMTGAASIVTIWGATWHSPGRIEEDAGGPDGTVENDANGGGEDAPDE